MIARIGVNGLHSTKELCCDDLQFKSVDRLLYFAIIVLYQCTSIVHYNTVLLQYLPKVLLWSTIMVLRPNELWIRPTIIPHIIIVI